MLLFVHEKIRAACPLGWLEVRIERVLPDERTIVPFIPQAFGVSPRDLGEAITAPMRFPDIERGVIDDLVEKSRRGHVLVMRLDYDEDGEFFAEPLKLEGSLVLLRPIAGRPTVGRVLATEAPPLAELLDAWDREDTEFAKRVRAFLSRSSFRVPYLDSSRFDSSERGEQERLRRRASALHEEWGISYAQALEIGTFFLTRDDDEGVPDNPLVADGDAEPSKPSEAS